MFKHISFFLNLSLFTFFVSVINPTISNAQTLEPGIPGVYGLEGVNDGTPIASLGKGLLNASSHPEIISATGDGARLDLNELAKEQQRTQFSSTDTIEPNTARAEPKVQKNSRNLNLNIEQPILNSNNHTSVFRAPLRAPKGGHLLN